MTISTADWKRYIDRLRRISDKAAEEMQRYVQLHGFGDMDALIEFAWALATKYGEAAATAACDMFDAVAEASGVTIPGALPAETATYAETARAVYGALKQGAAKVPDTVGRLVKQAGADTTLQNAERNGAEFAWVPMGDTCSFCLMLASRGWQNQSKKAMKNGHAEHIHANCDCQYATRFDGKGGVAGYDPDEYKAMYDAAEGDKWREKLNSMRRERYKLNRDKILEQKRAIYERNRRLNYGAKAEIDSDRGTISARRIDRYGYNNLYIDDRISLTERQLRSINGRVSEAKSLLGVTGSFDANVVVTDIGDVLASYNPRTNTMLVSKDMNSPDEIVRRQQGFACPEDTRSTFVHELFHWSDADEYRKAYGNIDAAGPTSPYSVYQRERAFSALEQAGVNLTDNGTLLEISYYALDAALDNDWEEVYTEYRTKVMLEGS